MIEIQIRKGACFLEARGHAGHGEYGKDIVCAAVSALVSTLASCVWDDYHKKLLQREPDISLGRDGSGYARIACQPRRKYREIMLHDFSVITSGLHLLAEQYPDAVSLQYIN